VTERAAKRRIAADAGFTLPELLIATVIGLMVVGAAVTVFSSAVRSQPEVSQRNAAIQQARTMSETLTRELRQGSNATTTSGDNLAILTYVPRAACGSTAVGPSTRCRVFYSCSSAGTCTRTECPPDFTAVGAGCGPTRTVVTGLADNNVFTFSPRVPGEAYVGVRLAFPAANGDDAITLHDGIALRNPPLGGP
jgi:prepilin-type N-terminal cleavage/methylation domain-containing protein